MAELYSIVDAPEATVPLPRGLYEIVPGGDASRDQSLVHAASGQRFALKDCAQTPRDGGDLDLRAPGFRLRLRPVGRAKLTAAEWETVRAALQGRVAELARLPVGSAQHIRIQAVELSRSGLAIRYRADGQGLASLTVASPTYAAFRWTPGALEARTSAGLGLRFKLYDCPRCGKALESAKGVRSVEGVEHCAACAEQIAAEHRSEAQRRVGICRGCLFYGIAVGGDRGRVSVCLNAARVKAKGQITDAPVARCAYRKVRRRGLVRREVRLDDPKDEPGAAPSR